MLVPTLTSFLSLIWFSAFISAHTMESYLVQNHAKSQARRDCRSVVTIAAEDSCATLAAKCNVSEAKLVNANLNTLLCSNLRSGRGVCCPQDERVFLEDRDDQDGGDDIDTGDGDADDDDDDDDSEYDEDSPPGFMDAPSPCDDHYETIDDLDKAVSKIPDYCKTQYTVDTLTTMLHTALDNYTDLMKHNYDKKFDTYAKSVSENAGQSVENFMNDNGNKYFTCIVTEQEPCCKDCRLKAGKDADQQCQYCFNGKCNKKRESVGSITGADSEDQQFKVSNQTEPCPPDYSKRGYGPSNPYTQSVYWTLSGDKTDQFYADLMSTAGIPKEKTKIGDFNRNNGCPPSAKPHDGNDCWNDGMDYGFPMINGYGPGDVANPKDMFNKALANITGLRDQLDDILEDIRANAFTGGDDELIDSISLPIFMISEASENMGTVEETAEKIDEERKKAIILAIISAILFFVPAVGEIVGAVADMGSIAAVISMLGVAGNTAMDVYTLVDDPKNAPLAIFSLIMEPLALADVAILARTANIRRGMADADIAKLSSKLAGRMGTIQKITGVCKKTA